MKTECLYILGKLYTIKRVPRAEFGSGSDATCHFYDHTIRLRDDLCEQASIDSALHEGLHVIAQSLGVDLEENEVCALTAGFYALIADNPEFIDEVVRASEPIC